MEIVRAGSGHSLRSEWFHAFGEDVRRSILLLHAAFDDKEGLLRNQQPLTLEQC